VQVPASADELRGAAAVMYYGGDVAELLPAFALVTTLAAAADGATGEQGGADGAIDG
jgi:hypothetical protein